jgi:hypothetical protein
MAREDSRGKRAVEEIPKDEIKYLLFTSTASYSDSHINVLNDSLRPLPLMAEGPSNAANATSSTLDSSVDFSNLYNGDDAHCYLQEWRMAKGRYSKVSRENGQLEICLKVTEVTLHATEEETSIVWTGLAKADAMVAGKFHFLRENAFSCP